MTRRDLPSEDPLKIRPNYSAEGGFEITEIITDPQSSLVGIPGVNCTGAGYHIPKLDTRVRRLKELVRSVVAGLHFKIPGNLVQDLVSYAVNRINTRRSSGSISTECPWVKFTGKKVNYKREFTLSFGDCVECYDPTSRGNSMKERTNSCIALHPCGNISGSWHFLNLLTGRRVRRSRWVKMIQEEETKDDINRDEVRRSYRLKLKAQRIMSQKGAEGFAMSNISVRKAIKHDPKRAAEAIHKELEQMLKGKKVFAPVKRRDVPNSRVIRSHMFLKYKYDAQGKLEKLKARLVADGKLQDREQYPNNYSPTVSLEAIITTLK